MIQIINIYVLFYLDKEQENKFINRFCYFQKCIKLQKIFYLRSYNIKLQKNKKKDK